MRINKEMTGTSNLRVAMAASFTGDLCNTAYLEMALVRNK